MADLTNVFVVHGRNSAANDAVFAFLRALELRPIEWSEAVQKTGKGSPYIGEVLKAGFSIAQAVVVIFTPDDEARLREPYRGQGEPLHETQLTGQPRQNVLLEAGMALGTHEDRTIIVEIGEVRPMSDTLGRHVIKMDGSSPRRHEVAERLKTAGCKVNQSGTDWLSAGDFTNCVITSKTAAKEISVPDFAGQLEGLNSEELYWLARRVIDGSKTDSDCGFNDVTPQLLASKGLAQKVPLVLNMRNPRVAYTIPDNVWQYLNERKKCLLERCAAKNQGRADRMEVLAPALTALDEMPVEDPKS